MKKKATHRSDGGPIAVAEDQTVADLVVHIHLENNILFPGAVAMEQTL